MESAKVKQNELIAKEAGLREALEEYKAKQKILEDNALKMQVIHMLM